MTKTKKTLLAIAVSSAFFLLLALLFAFAAVICGLIADRTDKALGGMEPVYVAFSSDGFVKSEKIIKADSLDHYEPVYGKFNSYVYFGSLNESEKTVYRAFEYALDNCFTDVCIDSRALEECRYSAADILRLLSLDSPMVEQSLCLLTGKSSIRTGAIIKRSLPCVHVGIPSFGRETLDLKAYAIERAYSIAAGAEGLEELEAVGYVFDYLVDSIEYYDYHDSENKIKCCLYDALCTGRTSCDGYANAFSLLMHIRGFECFEKCYFPQEEDKAGHTWNCFMLGGNRYNADATYTYTGEGKLSECDLIEKETIYFGKLGFPDSRQKYTPAYSEITPGCTESLYKADLTLVSGDEAPVDEICRLLTEKNGILILSDHDLGSDIMREIANRTHKKVYYSTTVTGEQYVCSVKLSD